MRQVIYKCFYPFLNRNAHSKTVSVLSLQEASKHRKYIFLRKGVDCIKFIKLLILLIPMPFLFHYIETSVANGSILAFIGILLFVIVAGLLSTKNKLYFILLINILSVLVSVALGGKFITPPNESWFNPFGLNFAIIFTGIIILIGVIIVRSVSRVVLLKTEK